MQKVGIRKEKIVLQSIKWLPIHVIVLLYNFLFVGIPLLEENEVENEGSNSSEPGDTASATCSEGSSK